MVHIQVLVFHLPNSDISFVLSSQESQHTCPSTSTRDPFCFCLPSHHPLFCLSVTLNCLFTEIIQAKIHVLFSMVSPSDSPNMHPDQGDMESKLEDKESRPPSSQSQRLASPSATTLTFTAVAILRARRIRARRLNNRRAHQFAKRLRAVLNASDEGDLLKGLKGSKAAKILKGIISKRRLQIKARFRRQQAKLGSLDSQASSASPEESKPELKVETKEPDPATQIPLPEVFKGPLSKRRRRIQARLQAKLKVAEPKVPISPQSPSGEKESKPKVEQQNAATKRRDRRERMKRARKQSDRGKQTSHARVRDPNWKSGVSMRQAML